MGWVRGWLGGSKAGRERGGFSFRARPFLVASLPASDDLLFLHHSQVVDDITQAGQLPEKYRKKIFVQQSTRSLSLVSQFGAA